LSVRRLRIFYALGGVGAEALVQSRNVWLIYFYAPPEDADRTALLSLGVVTSLLFAGKLVEAFDDTLIGWWSDRTQSRWGRRIPFILSAAPLAAVCAFLAFVPPAGMDGWALAAWFFVTLQLFQLFDTLTGGPYEALLPAIARTSQERVNISTLRVLFGVGGAAVGLVGSGLLVSLAGFPAMIAVMAGLALLTRYLGLAGIWGAAKHDSQASREPLWPSLKAAWSNRHYLVFLPSFVLFQVGLTMLTAMLPYYAKGILKAEDEGAWVAILTGVSILAMAATIPLYLWLARRTSKRFAYRQAMLAAGLAFPLLALPGLLPGVPLTAQVLAVMAIAGAPIAAVYLFPGPLIADICDDDAARTGNHREGVFYGGFAFAVKVVGALAPLLLGGILMLGPSAENPLGIRLIGPAAGVIALAGWYVFRAYTLEDTRAVIPSRVFEVELSKLEVAG
jgi:GPH family glycoside/pentoside/hexuronide:cation symporter